MLAMHGVLEPEVFKDLSDLSGGVLLMGSSSLSTVGDQSY
jgi:hypothetical protein